MAASSFAIGVNCLLILRGFLGAFRSRPLQGFASLKLQDGGSEAPETLCLEPGAEGRGPRSSIRGRYSVSAPPRAPIPLAESVTALRGSESDLTP